MIANLTSLNWSNLHSLAIVQANDILEITTFKGKTIEELVQFLEIRFPGITLELASAYLGKIELLLQPNSMPPREEVLQCVNRYLEQTPTDIQKVRDATVDAFFGKVDNKSPEAVKRLMAATIELALGENVSSLNDAGFAECEHSLIDFGGELAKRTEKADECMIQSERSKAAVLAEIIMQRRSA
jgi:hypothetical protein